MANTDLVERLKEAGGPNFALDILVAQTLVPDIVVMRRNNDDTGNEPFTYRNFTADIGDALWLVETLLPDTYYFFAKGRTRPDEPLFAFQILTGQKVMGDNEAIAEAEHESAPICILLALCAALSQKETGNAA